MNSLRIALLLTFASMAALAQDVAPPVSLGGPAGITGGLSLDGQNILTHMTDAPYTMIPAGWWAGTQIVPSSLTLTAARAITAPANGGQPYFFCNFSTGGFTVTVGASTGTTVPVPNGSCEEMHYVGTTGYVATRTVGAVSSVFGRTGSVVAASGDYTVAQVTGAAPIASPTFTGTATSPSYVATGGTPGVQTPSVQLTTVTVAGCATLDAAGNLSSTNVACAAVAGVTSLNTLTGAMVLTAGSNIALTTVGNNITINGIVNAPTQTEYTPGGARALGTVYQNLTSHLLIVTVFFLNSSSTAFGTAFGYEDTTSTPVQYAGGCTSPASSVSFSTPCSFTMEVPPLSYYEVKTFGALTNFMTWYESTP